ncbi:alpha/beta hydrolase family protein [Anaerosacchariphilus polymeriproducens]|uniref:Uncharacterized protein n=1 Tax=Anaerosacchariphilus polymeriproducens TaxID=1812858 RepID=A0A371B031_9FIRM|nr:hypothetical protein [Anaerosacchariphilus polymeriproducens]RDU25228.1 hypothetical protein DWV06_00020 [Anaerosacchariphilus polymeriproducens]
MRIFELLLILSELFLMYLLFKKKECHKILFVSGVSTVILIIHFIVEGYRWQMLFPYLVTVIFLIVSSYRYLKKSDSIKIPKKLTYVINIFLVLLILISAGLSIILPVFKMPEPTGTYQTGTKIYHYINENSDKNFIEDENNEREIMIQVWYPAQNIKDKKRSNIIPNSKIFLKEIAKEYNIPEFLLDYLKYTKSNSFDDAEISNSCNSYPLIILNHGLGTSRLLHITQAENLASHGYIVVSIDHTYSSIKTLFPNGKSTNFMISEDKLNTSLEYRIGVEKMWVKDIKFIVDRFIKANSDTESFFNGKVDINNIGIFGHSFGGAAAFDLCYNDSRFKAGIDLDGSLYSCTQYKPDNKSMNKPFMFVFSDEHFQFCKTVLERSYTTEDLKKMGFTREQYEKAKDEMLLPYKATAKNGGNVLYIKNTKHYNFTDLQLVSPLIRFTGMTGNIDGERASYIVNQYVLDFFNKHLKNIDGKLLEGPNQKFPEVIFGNKSILKEN